MTTNTTIFNDADPDEVRRFFDEAMSLGVEGMMISPGFPYNKAPARTYSSNATRRLNFSERYFPTRRENGCSTTPRDSSHF